VGAQGGKRARLCQISILHRVRETLKCEKPLRRLCLAVEAVAVVELSGFSGFSDPNYPVMEPLYGSGDGTEWLPCTAAEQHGGRSGYGGGSGRNGGSGDGTERFLRPVPVAVEAVVVE